tara:strand:+ start:2130 stop:2402 length:273 start_codon:yes stop_codon:yes gene_type:complete
VRTYKDKVLTPSLVSETSSDREMMPQTIEKNIKGIMISFSAEMNKSDTKLKIFEIMKLATRLSWLKKLRIIPKKIPNIIATMIFFVKDII